MNFTGSKIQSFAIITILILFTACGNTNSSNNKPSIHKTSVSTGEISSEETIKGLHKIHTTPVATVQINELLSANANTNYDPDFKEFSDWIELANESNATINIGGYYLSDDEDNPTKWQIPHDTLIPADGYLLIWADGKDTVQKAIHTNFKLSQKGEIVTLSTPDEHIISTLNYPAQEGDISCAQKDGDITYMIPSPNAKNNTPYINRTKTQKPSFSLKSGFYDGAKEIRLSQKENAKIFYTTDGSHPSTTSTRYRAPIMIDKTTLIRAISVQEDKLPSPIVNRTYLIDEDISLPVVSIGIDDKYLHDDKIGIYKNFMKDWMRAGSVEYIQDGESKFSENVGIRLHGNSSRSYPQKSLSIYFKKRYGNDSLTYPLFRDKPTIHYVKSFMLRNSGTDWNKTLLRDGLTHTLAKEIHNIDFLSYEPTITFINGKYNGILNLREKPNKNYLKNNYQLKDNDINILRTMAKDTALAGDLTEYNSLLDYVQTHSLQDNENYNDVQNQIDINSFIRYNILQLFVGNVDWPQNNLKAWKERYKHSKWRWILYDTDMGFSLKLPKLPLYASPYHDALTRLDSPILNPNSEVLLYRKLLENPTYTNKFISTYTTLLNTIFKPNKLKNLIYKLKSSIEPEIKRHFKRWCVNPQKKFLQWENNIDYLYSFSKIREEIVRDQLAEYFHLKGKNILHIPKQESGKIYIEGISLNSDFQGTYFDDTKISLSAVADDGYQFSHWSNGNTNSNIIIDINQDSSISAIFTHLN